ncbi:CU044_5270 family protein [Nocardiopsis deserti]|uniref:CU044_5270 family protein n=1 Tax=Nocardiopsis deserti TaxID=2605988 RepID=UPI0012399784|nr:CU044_5270 family protein [Nocardiopsis deserti]
MNELDHLRRMRADVREPGIEELALRTGWRPGGGRPSRSRPVSLLPLTLSGAAVLTAAAVFAFLVLGPVGGPEPDSVAVGPGPTSSEEPGGAPGVMEVMGPVIEAARSQEADGGTWYVRTVRGSSRSAGSGEERYGVYGLQTWETWTSMEQGATTDRVVSTDWSLVRQEDRNAWERDGRPTYWPPDHETQSGEVPPDISDLGPSDEDHPVAYALGTEVLTFEELQDLSPDPEELSGLLLYASEEATVSENVDSIAHMLEYPFPPEVRAGVYTVLARLPGARPLEGVTDVSGRPAVGLAYDAGSGESGAYEYRLLLDPETGALLSYEVVVIEPAASDTAWLRPADVVGYRLHESMGWTDDRPE